jgi:hypothetical protein
MKTAMSSSPAVNLHNNISEPRSVSFTSGGNIERVDARNFQTEIVALFAASGNPQFASQFDWYYRDRGQETPISWILRDRKGNVSGLCSVTLRSLRFGSTEVRAGIAGNLTMDPGRGMYLGAFSLVRAMKSLVDSNEIDVLIGVPNQLAQPVFSRLNFKVIDSWTTQVQVRKSWDLLKFHLGLAGGMASPFVDLYAGARRAISHWNEVESSNFQAIELSEGELSALRLEDWASPWERFVMNASSEYLKWRFLRDPLRQFSIIAVTNPKCEVCGYLVLRHMPGRIWVADCGVDHGRLSETSAILCLCRDPKLNDNTVWITSLRSSPLAAELEYYGLFRVRPSRGGYPDYPLVGYWRPDHPLASAFAQPTSWRLFPGSNDV